MRVKKARMSIGSIRIGAQSCRMPAETSPSPRSEMRPDSQDMSIGAGKPTARRYVGAESVAMVCPGIVSRAPGPRTTAHSHGQPRNTVGASSHRWRRPRPATSSTAVPRTVTSSRSGTPAVMTNSSKPVPAAAAIDPVVRLRHRVSATSGAQIQTRITPRRPSDRAVVNSGDAIHSRAAKPRTQRRVSTLPAPT